MEELFSLPGRKIKARLIVLDYQANLKNNNESPNELFVTLPSVHEREDDFQLENVGGYQDKDDADFVSPKKRGPKRKAPEEKKENAYQKRQEELAKQQETSCSPCRSTAGSSWLHSTRSTARRRRRRWPG